MQDSLILYYNYLQMADIKQYFRGLFKNHQTQVLKSALIDVLDCKNKVARDVRAGKLQVNEQQTNLNDIKMNQKQLQFDSEFKSKRQILQKQIQNFRREQFESDEAYKKAKQELIMQRQQDIKQEKQERERKRKQIQEKTKKWSQQQKQLVKKRQSKLIQQEKIRQMQNKQRRLKSEEQKQQAKIDKRRQIQEKLKQIQDNRNKRQEMMRSLRSQSQDRIPLYVQYQKRAKQVQYQRNFEQNIQKKNHKLAMKVDFDVIKDHQRNFLAKIQERNQRFSQSRANATATLPDSDFNLFPNRSQDKIKQQLEKQKRRWKYQQKIKQIPIEIDQSKKVKVQIALDRAKNPFKYNFLSQKSLNQFQIYGQFKNFSINTNPREIGKNYLEQLKKVPKQSRIQKSSSVQLIKQTSISDRPKYRNYLAQLKLKKPDGEEQKDEIQKIVSNFKDKGKAYKQLERKSEILDSNLAEKYKQLKRLTPNNFKQILKKQSEIDQVYAKALKARLARLQISS